MAALDEPLVRELFAQHLADCRYKQSTIAQKLDKIEHFFLFAAARGIADFREVGERDIEGFLEAERRKVSKRTGEPYQSSTVVGAFSAVRVLFTALFRAELILRNPTREVRPRPPHKAHHKRVFSEEEIARFLDGIDIHERLGLRDRTMFELMYSSGLRAGEVGKLDRGDIDLEGRMIIVREAKWSKDRMVPMNGVARSFLSIYFGGEGKVADPAFMGQRGRLGAGSVSKRFRLHLRKAGLEGRGLTAHSIRHATATHLLAHGADLRYVQELLGHESIETTVVYTNELFDNLKRIYRSHHPRENALYREVDAEYRQRVARLCARLENPKRLADRVRRAKKKGGKR
jgi:integrase/recombinase XerD